MEKVRVRFAPSPTGPLHIGGVRTALYNYLFAKKNNGSLILRIEDTDQTRYVEGAEDYIKKSLNWLGINFDESPDIGGDYKPYRQSERKNIYKQYADELVKNGYAYYAFDTAEELDMLRKSFEAEKKVFQYSINTRMDLNNSLTLPKDIYTQKIESGEPYVIRIKIPENITISLNDLIRGNVSVDSNQLDDKVLFKSDGMPTYHLANIVDDYLMKITHVIRGEEWLPSAPMHVLLYQFLGWEKQMPQFAHLPLLLKPDGNGKLSKRDGDRLGFPVFPLEWKDNASGEVYSGYKESGYLPEAVINMLALLGWNPGTEQEIFSIDELINLFSLERVNKSGAKFDLEKAHWFNHKYLSSYPTEKLTEMLLNILYEKQIKADYDFVYKVCELVSDRLTLIPDLWTQTEFFFIEPTNYDQKTKEKYWKQNTKEIIENYLKIILETENFEHQNIYEITKKYSEDNNISMGNLMNPLRLLLVGTNAGPSIVHIIEILGKEKTATRINNGLKKI